MAFAAAIALGFAPALAQTTGTVSVLYAGSLVTSMEGPIKAALRSEGIDFQGEPGGSKRLANLIAGGLSNPDVFISVDPKLVSRLGSKVGTAVTFAGTSLGVGWSDKSKYAALFADVAAGKKTMVQALSTPGLRIGRTDPQLDPKGLYTLQAAKLLFGSKAEKRLLGDDENPAQIFPEEDLLVRVETGEADVGFFYKTEALARVLHFVALPGAAALTHTIAYTLAVMRNAPHPAQAQAFSTFLLSGRGKAILEKAGVTYFVRPRKMRSGKK